MTSQLKKTRTCVYYKVPPPSTYISIFRIFFDSKTFFWFLVRVEPWGYQLFEEVRSTEHVYVSPGVSIFYLQDKILTAHPLFSIFMGMLSELLVWYVLGAPNSYINNLIFGYLSLLGIGPFLNYCEIRRPYRETVSFLTITLEQWSSNSAVATSQGAVEISKILHKNITKIDFIYKLLSEDFDT